MYPSFCLDYFLYGKSFECEYKINYILRYVMLFLHDMKEKASLAECS